MARLELSGVTVAYEKFTLSNVSFSCDGGEIVALVGRNGAGKTNGSLQMLAVMSAFVMDRSGGSLDGAAIAPAVLLAATAACLLLYAASAGLSIRAVGSFSRQG